MQQAHDDGTLVSSAGRWALPASVVVWLIHVALLADAFPLTALTSSLPLAYIDSPFHQYQVTVAGELWRDGALIGYDPWFAAGHVGGVSYNASAKMPALLAAMLPELLTPVTAYKVHVFFSAAIAPGFVLLAMRLLRSDCVTTLCATVLGFLLWWISALHWYHTAGMVSFVAASYAALAYIAQTWRTVTEPPRPSTVLALGLYGGFGVFYHPLFAIPVLFAAPLIVLTTWRRVVARSVLIVLPAVPVIALLVNIAWILPSIRHPGWSEGSLSPYQKVVDIGVVLSEAIGRIEGHARGAKLNPVLWFLASWAVWRTTDPEQRRIAWGFLMATLALIFFAALGAWWPPVATLQPNRLSASAYLLLVVPASIGLTSIIGLLRAPGSIRYAARLTLALLAPAAVLLAIEFANEVSAGDHPRYGRELPEVRGQGPTTIWLTDWLRGHTSTEARILFETSKGRVHDGAHIAGPLARATGREFVGGPYVFMHHAGFWDGHVFGRPIGEFTPDEFAKRLDLYNIGWIVAHSSESRAHLERHPLVTEVARREPVVVYRVRREPNYFLEGRGQITARRTNRIDLDSLAGEAVTLKYHYIDGLAADPPTLLQPVLQHGDPTPFIRIVAPPQRLSIFMP